MDKTTPTWHNTFVSFSREEHRQHARLHQYLFYRWDNVVYRVRDDEPVPIGGAVKPEARAEETTPTEVCTVSVLDTILTELASSSGVPISEIQLDQGIFLNTDLKPIDLLELVGVLEEHYSVDTGNYPWHEYRRGREALLRFPEQSGPTPNELCELFVGLLKAKLSQ